MDVLALSNSLRDYARLSGIPIALYDRQGELIMHSPHPLATLLQQDGLTLLKQERVLESLPDDEPPRCVISPDFLMYGKIPVQGTEYFLFLGPVLNYQRNEEQLLRAFTNLQPALPTLEFSDFRSYFQTVKTVRSSDFFTHLSALNGLINQVYVPSDAITSSFMSSSENSATFYSSLMSHEKSHVIDEVPRSDNYEYEARIMYLISHGQSEELRRLPSFSGHLPSLASTSLRASKNALIILNSLSSRAAIKGGVEPVVAYQYAEVFLHQIEAAVSLPQLFQMGNNMNMAATYADLVASAKMPQTDSKAVNDTISYIQKHYDAPMSVPELAAAAGLSPEYLSTLFRQKTGDSLTHYIQEIKINSAKAMLRFSKASLAEIAAALSFSSQPYFQKVFKQITGQTPGEYRRKHEV